jgi:DNA-binding GntR family transcriptional regulator
MDDLADTVDEPRFSTRAEHLREQLTEEIIAGLLPPGTKLDEQELADRFGVSRTPVREAMRQLIATGLVVSRPHRGATVAGFSSDRLADFLEAATEIEVACVRLAAVKMGPVEQARLAAHHNAMRDILNGDPDHFSTLNDQFHDMIYRGSHNSALLEIARTLQVRMRPVYRVQLTVSRRMRQSFAEHEHILAAIMRGDAGASELAMRTHMQASALELERLNRGMGQA